MTELTTDLKSLHEATLNNLKSSKANNTLRAYKSDFKDFGAFCAKHGLNSLPSEPKIVSRIENWVSGQPNFILKRADRVIPIAPMKIAVSKYCLPIILWS